MSQETLAEMIGTTRSRVNYFMNKFRKLGFIEYGGNPPWVQINESFTRVLEDQGPRAAKELLRIELLDLP